MAANNINIDLSNATEKELETIKSQIVARLAQRVKAPGDLVAEYDRHGSGHSRSSALEKDININPGLRR